MTIEVLGDDPAEVDAEARRLLAELEALDYDPEFAKGPPPPPDTKGWDPVSVTTVVVTVTGPQAFLLLGRTLHAWASRDRHRRLRVDDGGEPVEVSGEDPMRRFFSREAG
ncbi:hypothetical protein GCM10022243_06670 [Saccharothrix violaceirubra]